MTDEPIDLDKIRRSMFGKHAGAVVMADEIERLRAERDALQARIDAAVRAFEAHDANYEFWAVDCLGEVIAALTCPDGRPVYGTVSE